MLKLKIAAARPAVPTPHRRAALPGPLPFGRKPKQAAPPGLIAPLLEAARLPTPELLARYDATLAGPPPAEAADRLALFGLNEVGRERLTGDGSALSSLLFAHTFFLYKS